MSHAHGTFRAKISAPMLTYPKVRCASVLAFHHELHSRTGLIKGVV
jgi:hypothetical protein